MRLTLEAAIINGDDTFDPRAFNGQSKRLVPGEDQTIDNGGTTSVFDGWANSEAMNNGSHPAAQFCCGLIIGGYDDW